MHYVTAQSCKTNMLFGTKQTNLRADTETENVHIDGFLKVSDAGVNSSEIVERTRLRVRHVAKITFNQQ